MRNRLVVVLLVSLGIYTSWTSATNVLLYDPFYLYECPANIASRHTAWHLVYGSNQVLRHSDHRFDEIMAVVKKARKQGKLVQVNRENLTRQVYKMRFGLEVIKSEVDFVCDECSLSRVLTVSEVPINFSFIQINSSALAYSRKAHRLAFSSDEKWILNYNYRAYPIWITKRVADHLREILPKNKTVFLNNRAFLDPDLKDDPNDYIEDLPLDLLVTPETSGL